MSKKLAAKNALISLLSAPKLIEDTEADNRPQQVARTRTAVGGMAQFVTTQSPIHLEAEALREQVKQFTGAKLVRALDASSIVSSSLANRHASNFDLGDFAQLKREIRESGGNVQPIKVRPLRPVVDSTASAPASASASASALEPKNCTALYEIVYGHRRHRACLELGIPVNALIEAVDDQTLFEEMERENRGRKNLSAWEQGCMYLAALERGLYPSQRKLSEAIGVDVSLISKSMSLARLPLAVIEAFTNPLEIQFRWAQPLAEAIARDANLVIQTAVQIKQMPAEKPLASIAVFNRLTSPRTVFPAVTAANDLTLSVLQVDGRVIAEWLPGVNGGGQLRIKPEVLPAERHAAFIARVQAFFAV